MKKFPQATASVYRGRALVAALAIGGAAGALTLPAAAQVGGTKQGPAEVAEVPPAKVQVFETSAALRQATMKAIAPAASDEAAPTSATTIATAMAAARADRQPEVDVRWMLDSTTRPWPLAYTDLNPLNTLALALPAEREARLMLPGAVSDVTDRARFIVSRYVTDNIGSAAQARGRQLESFNLWVDSVQRQKKLLPKDPWAQYQFSLEVQENLTPFKTKIKAQTEPTLQRMTEDINTAVAKITPLMQIMGAYDQQLQWYNILVQLKEGIVLYQTRALDSDRQILDAVEAFERDNPPVARPQGRPPVKPGTDGAAPAIPLEQPAQHASMSAPSQRDPAQAPSAKQQPNGVSGSVILLAVGAMVIGFFVMLRKRVAGKTRTPKATE